MVDAAAAADDHHYDDHHRDDLDDHDDDHWWYIYIFIYVKQRTYITCSRRFGPPTSLRYLEGCLRSATARSKVPPFFFQWCSPEVENLTILSVQQWFDHGRETAKGLVLFTQSHRSEFLKHSSAKFHWAYLFIWLFLEYRMSFQLRALVGFSQYNWVNHGDDKSQNWIP